MTHDTLSGTVLIAEDDDAFRARLDKAMTKRGFTVIAAASVAQAVDSLDGHAVDFAVVDLRLGDGSGLDVVETLKVLHPHARSVILTGYGDTPTAVAAVKLGAIDYLAKPATADEIIDALMAPDGAQPTPPDAPISPEDARRVHIETVFQEAGENVSQAARLLNMHRRTLQRNLKRYAEDAAAGDRTSRG